VLLSKLWVRGFECAAVTAKVWAQSGMSRPFSCVFVFLTLFSFLVRWAAAPLRRRHLHALVPDLEPPPSVVSSWYARMQSSSSHQYSSHHHINTVLIVTSMQAVLIITSSSIAQAALVGRKS